MPSSRWGEAAKRFLSWGNPLSNTKNISTKMMQSNCMVLKEQSNMENYFFKKTEQNEQKITQSSSLRDSDKSENNFMHLNHQGYTRQRFLQSFQNCSISVRNGGIYRQTNKQSMWQNSLTEDENIKFTLVENGALVISRNRIAFARIQMPSHILH